jgi:hypothetical protein
VDKSGERELCYQGDARKKAALVRVRASELEENCVSEGAREQERERY